MLTRPKRAFSLVEILVVVVIIAALAAFMLPKYLGKGTTAGGKTIDSPMQRGHAPECANNLNQIRQAYTMAVMASEENKPRSLADLKTYGVSDAMTRCPVDNQPYQFDANTGQVRCPHPGH